MTNTVTVASGAALHLLPLAQTPTDEVQTVALAGASGGTFTLTREWPNHRRRSPTMPRPPPFKSALGALSSIGGIANVKVTLAGRVYTVTFQGTLADHLIPTMTAVSSLTGSSPTVTVTTTAGGSLGAMTMNYTLVLNGTGISARPPT